MSDIPTDGPGIGRAIALTDGIVAIAITLLVLPLVDIAGELDSADPVQFWTDHQNQLMSFLISFLVIYAFWTAHGSVFAHLTGSHRQEVPGLQLLNMLWLLGIAVLPFPTAIIGVDLTTASAPLYLGTMLVLSGVTMIMSVLVARAAGAREPGPWHWGTTAVFAVCMVVAFAQPVLAMYLLLLLIPVRMIEGRLEPEARRAGVSRSARRR